MKEIGKAVKLRRILLICFLFFSHPSFAKFSPETDWRSVNTAHFRIAYPSSYQRFTESLAQYLEEAYEVLSKDLHWKLESRAEVVVNGDTDFANGLTSVFPLNRIVFNAVPFSESSSIGEYDNWIRTLAFHELTHLIANDSTRGIFALGRSFFGSAAKMNSYQPQWIVEGLAVHEETIRSQYGRGRSVWVDTQIRAAIKDGLLNQGSSLFGVTLDRLPEGPPIWPGPLAPYLYGYVMEEMLVEAGGDAAPGLTSYLSAGTLPFLIDWVSREASSQSYSQLWDRAVARLTELAQTDLALIHSKPVTEPKFMSSSGRSSGASAGVGTRLFYVRDSYSSGTGLSQLELSTRREKRVSDWRYGGETSLRSKGQFLLYSRFDLVDEFKTYLDVYLWDTELEKEIRLTEGARARDPDFSPDFDFKDGKIVRGAIVYVKNQGDANQAIVIFDGNQERILVQGKAFERFSSPTWNGGDPTWIVYSSKPNGGRERLLAAHVATSEVRVITQAQGLRVSELTPSWNEQRELVFASSVDGIYNIYKIPTNEVLSGTGRPEKITQLETGALYPIFISGKLYATVYHSSGYDIAELPTAHAVELQPHIQALHNRLHPDKLPGDTFAENTTPSSSEPLKEAPSITPEAASPFPALWPKYFLPYAQKVVDGFVVGAFTSGIDSTENHYYHLSAAYDSRASFPIYEAIYRYDGLYPSIQIERKQDNLYVGLSAISNAVATTQLKMIYPLGLVSVTFGGTYLNSAYIGQTASNGGLQAMLSYSDNRIYANSIDPSAGDNGFRGDLSATGYVLGDEQFAAYEGRLEQRIPFLFPENFFRLFATGAHSNNKFFDSNYYVGGGESNVAFLENYLIRGYQPGAIIGRDLATFNLEYWMPLADVFRGFGTLPFFYQRTKLKLFIDTGSAESVANRLGSFTYWPVGTGAQLLQDLNLFYRVPVTVAVGVDYGLNASLGGQTQLVLGLYGQFN